MKITPDIAIEQQKQIEPCKNSSPDTDLSARDIQLMKKSNELEAVFLTQLIKSMEKTIPDGLGGGKNSLSTMMFSSVMGDAMTQGGGIGLSKMIFASLRSMDGAPDTQELGGEDYLQTFNVLQSISSLKDEQ
ncbi:MAG: rod-binding protein [Candidatus Marinimicrobia bacterium]|nr:rod-binding protein [Candidatus Neomarinimicrobiota bacterium]